MEADRALAYHMTTLQVAKDVLIFLIFALAPVAFITFSSELRARTHFAGMHHMTCDEVGSFWNRWLAAGGQPRSSIAQVLAPCPRLHAH